MEVNIHEAKTHLSRLLDRVEHGEEVVIVRSNVPVAKLIAVPPTTIRRELGWARGEFEMSDDFDDPLPQKIEDSFYK